MASFEQTLTGNGSTGEFTTAKPFLVMLSGTVNGSTVVEVKTPGEDWVPFTDSAKTEASAQVLDVPGLNRYRLTLTGSTAPSIDVYISSDDLVR